MREILGITLDSGTREEVLPGYSADFPCIASCARLDEYTVPLVPWHWHLPVEIFYMESGTLEYETPGGRMIFPVGSGGMINSNVLHRTRPLPSGGKTVQLLHIFDPALLELGADQQHFPHCCHESAGSFAGFCERLRPVSGAELCGSGIPGDTGGSTPEGKAVPAYDLRDCRGAGGDRGTGDRLKQVSSGHCQCVSYIILQDGERRYLILTQSSYQIDYAGKFGIIGMFKRAKSGACPALNDLKNMTQHKKGAAQSAPLVITLAFIYMKIKELQNGYQSEDYR